MDKRGSTFGAIIAVIGAILIALGFAWLIAQNWHQFSSVVKIAILLLVTGGAFSAGYFVQEKYERIAKALFVLGNLLFVLSVFLIAQVFQLSMNSQTTANLFLISFLGVAFSSYYFGSYTSLIISFAGFLIWLNVQFFALSPVYLGRGPSLAFYLILNLAAGVLFQGISWIHQAKDHYFGKLYNWWALFFFLVFGYVLSFQSLIPMIWQSEVDWLGSQAIFAGVFAVLAVAAFTVGIVKAIDFSWKKRGLILLIILLVAFIFASKLAYTQESIKTGYGVCYEKSCNDYIAEDTCLNTLGCDWQNGACDYERFNVDTKYCSLKFDLKGTPICDPNCKLDVKPISGKDESLVSCLTDCESLNDKSSCREYSECAWIQDVCQSRTSAGNKAQAVDELNKPAGCYDIKTEQDCLADSACRWDVNYFTDYEHRAPPRVWTFWTIVNVLFLLMILGVIGLGSYEKSESIINLGIFFFVLDIISRYIGFIMDFWGYTSLALIFISGGVLLIGGGYLLEKWRRKLVSETKENVFTRVKRK